MPNRVLRDWTESEKVNKLSVYGERFFTRLIMKADDYGRFHADINLLRHSLYPHLLDKIKNGEVKRALNECLEVGLLLQYEHSTRKYVQIIDFRQRLDKSKEKYPAPNQLVKLKFDNDSLSLTKRNETKRNEEEGKPENPPPPTPEYLKPIELTPYVSREIDARDCKTAKEKIFGDEVFIELLAKGNFLEIEEVTNLLQKFFKQKEGTLKIWDNETDLRENIINWMPKYQQLKRKESGTVTGSVWTTKKPPTG